MTRVEIHRSYLLAYGRGQIARMKGGKMKPLYKRYADEKPAGVYTMGYCGYLFFEPKDDDKYTCDFVVCFEYPNSKEPSGYTRAEYRRHNVHYTDSYDNPRAYVWRDHTRVYLGDVMRTNY